MSLMTFHNFLANCHFSVSCISFWFHWTLHTEVYSQIVLSWAFVDSRVLALLCHRMPCFTLIWWGLLWLSAGLTGLYSQCFVPSFTVISRCWEESAFVLIVIPSDLICLSLWKLLEFVSTVYSVFVCESIFIFLSVCDVHFQLNQNIF